MSVRTSMITTMVVVVMGALAATACDDDPAEVQPPTMAEVAGDYTAAAQVGAFTTDDGDVTDMLDAGAEVSLSLDEDGTLTGSLMIPGAGEGGADLEVDLAGSWTLDDFEVTLDLDADSFLDAAQFTWDDGGTLAGDGDYAADVTWAMELKRA